MQPKPEDYDYELDRGARAVVGIRALVPPDAFTAEILGTERVGHGALIRKDGIVLTIGYLVTEADTVWISLSDGSTVPGHVLGYDQETGFGLVQALARVDAPVLPLGRSSLSGGRHARGGRRIRRSQAAPWRRALSPSRNFPATGSTCWTRRSSRRPRTPSGAEPAMIGPAGDLLGIGSLQIQQATASPQGRTQQSDDANMIVPIDLLQPIFDDLATIGRPNRPARPWLGLYATEVGNSVALVGLADRGPAQGRPARRRHRAGRGGRAGDRSRGPVPPSLGTRRGWRHGAPDHQSRRPHLRRERSFRRSPPSAQGACPA